MTAFFSTCKFFYLFFSHDVNFAHVLWCCSYVRTHKMVKIHMAKKYPVSAYYETIWHSMISSSYKKKVWLIRISLTIFSRDDINTTFSKWTEMLKHCINLVHNIKLYVVYLNTYSYVPPSAGWCISQQAKTKKKRIPIHFT